MVDVVAALKFFHYPDNTQHLVPGQLIAAHFDLKPANILVDEDGSLIVTDFGQARIKGLQADGGTSLTAQVGTYAYRPPNTPRPASPGDINNRWSRAYDVWSTACIMTEVIEYIVNGGKDGFLLFRQRRLDEDANLPASSTNFWKTKQGPEGFQLKESVQRTLEGFRIFNDQYLNTVTDVLERMFSIDPSKRPTIAECLGIISQNVPTDDWPLLDDDEISICGLGTTPLLRNMSVLESTEGKEDIRDGLADSLFAGILSSNERRRIRTEDARCICY
jgi:serine/threonine protein kinase